MCIENRTTLRAIMSVAALSFAFVSYGQQLNAYWSGNGTLADSSGNGNTLTNSGSSFGTGYLQPQAFLLDGSSHLAASSPSFYLGSSSFTINVWANFASLGGGSYGSLPNTLVAQDEGGGYQSKWAFFLDAQDNALAFHVNGPGSSDAFAGASIGSLSTIGAWNMFTVTGSSSSVSFYADGQFLGSATGVTLPTSVSAPITIGEAEGIGYVNGSLEKIGIYNGALSASQVSQLYTATPEIPPSAVLGLGAIGLLIRKRRK